MTREAAWARILVLERETMALKAEIRTRHIEFRQLMKVVSGGETVDPVEAHWKRYWENHPTKEVTPI